MLIPLLLSFFATLAAAVMAYGTDPRWVHHGGWGIGLIMLSRRLQWPMIALSLILCLALFAVVISGKRRVFWLLGLLPVLALFGHRFVTGPANRYGVLDEPAMVAADQAKDLSADEYVVGVVLNDQPYAYPFSALYSNPVVVQSQREKRLLLMWSPFANGATVLDVTRDVKGRDLEVVSDPADSLLVYDSRTGQFLVALTGQPPGGGKMNGAEGTLRAVKETWGRWVTEHPDTKVLAMAGTGPKAPVLPHEIAEPTTRPTTAPSPASASARRLVVLIGSDSPVALPADQIGEAPLNTTAGGVPIVLFRDKTTGRVRAFDRHVEQDLIPVFSLPRDATKHKNAFMVDSDAATGWSAGGVAVDGDKAIKGKRLKPVEVREDVYLGPAKFWYRNLTLYDRDATAAPVTSQTAAATRPENVDPADLTTPEDRKPIADRRGQRTRPSTPHPVRPRQKQR